MKTRLTLAGAGAAAVFGLGAGPGSADPMRPLAAPAAAASAAPVVPVAPPGSREPQPIQTDRLVAIRRDADGRYQALIGERWLRLGDKVGGRAGNATVRALDATSVTLVQGRQQLVLHVLPPLLVSPTDPAGRPQAAGAPRTAALRDGMVAPPAPTSSTRAAP